LHCSETNLAVTADQDIHSAVSVLARGTAELGIAVQSTHRALFAAYLRELLDWNTRINLTAIDDPSSVATHHFLDSLTCLTVVQPKLGDWVVDVGTGAGFPGVPLKILRPDLRLTLLDSLQKRIAFLEHLVSALRLADVTLCHARAEDAGRSSAHRERYDLVLSRAVAQLRVLAELCLPLAKVGGTFLAMKGPKGYEEIAEAGNALRALGGEIAQVKELQLPIAGEQRLLIVVRKVEPTPHKYPRKAGQPTRSPL